MNSTSPRNLFAGIVVAAGLVAHAPAFAAPVSITVNGTFTDAPDSLTVGSNVLAPLVGLGFTSTFNYDPTSAQINTEFASPAEGGSGQELGTEFTSGSATPLIPALPVTPPDTNTFTSPTLIAEQENNVTPVGSRFAQPAACRLQLRLFLGQWLGTLARRSAAARRLPAMGTPSTASLSA